MTLGSSFQYGKLQWTDNKKLAVQVKCGDATTEEQIAKNKLVDQTRN